MTKTSTIYGLSTDLDCSVGIYDSATISLQGLNYTNTVHTSKHKWRKTLKFYTNLKGTQNVTVGHLHVFFH